jgi:hypothetical protein
MQEVYSRDSQFPTIDETAASTEWRVLSFSLLQKCAPELLRKSLHWHPKEETGALQNELETSPAHAEQLAQHGPVTPNLC